MITKMVLVPEESQTGGSNETEIEAKPMEIDVKKRIDRNPQKIQRLLKIILKIAQNNAYTDDLQIRDIDGNPISDSDITLLLNSAISNQRVLVGEKDFIRLLYESKVDPNLIINENMRNKLINFKPKPKPPIEPPIEPTVEPKPKKRKNIETDETPSKKSDVKTNAWEVPLPDDEQDI